MLVLPGLSLPRWIREALSTWFCPGGLGWRHLGWHLPHFYWWVSLGVSGLGTFLVELVLLREIFLVSCMFWAVFLHPSYLSLVLKIFGCVSAFSIRFIFFDV